MKHQNITYCLISSLLLAAGASLQANGKSFFPIYDEANSGAWQGIDYDGDPWVFNVSRPYFVTAGLQNRHLSLWASHGRYYYADRDVWKWQRPNLFCTNEDLFTQTIVVPYLIPMLQNAGAIVFTPRERDCRGTKSSSIMMMLSSRFIISKRRRASDGKNAIRSVLPTATD